MLLLNVTRFTIDHQKWPKLGKNSIISLGQSSPQELKVGPHSRPYLLGIQNSFPALGEPGYIMAMWWSYCVHICGSSHMGGLEGL